MNSQELWGILYAKIKYCRLLTYPKITLDLKEVAKYSELSLKVMILFNLWEHSKAIKELGPNFCKK